MKLILSVDAVIPPLTGIGRYTWELARHYHAASNSRPVRFLFRDCWIDDPARLLHPDRFPTSPPRRGWRKIPYYRDLARWRVQRQLRTHFVHGPNYFLPVGAETGVVTVHDLSVFKFPETHPVERIRHFDEQFTSTLARAQHLITDSQATRKEVADYFGWPIDRITAIGLGVSSAYRIHTNEELVSSLSEWGLQRDQYSLCVSTLEPRKRVDRLIAAYSRLPISIKRNYPLVLVGGKGWLSNTLLKQIERAEQEGWLRYLGFVDEQKLPAIYAGARAFFFPSVYEGFGLPVLEALASGVPTLTSDSTSLPEVGGGATLLVPPDHDDELLTGIERILTDEMWRRNAIEVGLQVAARHDWETCSTRTYELCEKLAR